jgi:hypothetical protein
MQTMDKLTGAGRGRRPLVALALVAAAAVLAAVPLAGAALRHTADTGTFGQKQVETLVDSGGPDWLDVSGPYQIASSVSVSKLSAYVAGGSAVSRLRGVIYADSGGKPGAFAAVTPVLTINANQASGWVDLTFSSAVSLPAGSYWLGYWYADYNSRHFYVSVAGSERFAPATYGATGNPPSGFPTGMRSSASSYSLYATYTTSATPATPANLAAPTISWTEPSVGHYVFTATPGTWSNSPTSLTYWWARWPQGHVPTSNDFPSTYDMPVNFIRDATGLTLTLDRPDAMNYVLWVTATNSAGSSRAFAYVTFTPAELIVESVPEVVGTPRVGSTLVVGDAFIRGLPGTGVGETNGFRSTWLRCSSYDGQDCHALQTSAPGAYSSYVVTTADVGFMIRVDVWSDQVGSKTVVLESLPTAEVTG